jgi:pyruvate,water dikinase
MPLNPAWAALLLWTVCPLMGGLPLTGWVTQLFARKDLSRLGTGNIGVSAAFYHGGTLAGILAVIFEAGKGIGAVCLARYLFADSYWMLIALIALVLGRYFLGKGAGATNVAWGGLVYDWQVTLLVFIIGGISFTLLRERQQGRLAMLILTPIVIYIQRRSISQTLVAMLLAGLLAWIYQRIPDDLDLKPEQAQPGSQKMFQFFRGDRAVLSLDHPLKPAQAGQKAATLAQLKQWGYPVPQGWVLPAGDDPEPLIEYLSPSQAYPLVVRSSAVGEDTEHASAAGQYRSILNVTSRVALLNAINECQAFYLQPHAQQYRHDWGISEVAGLAVLVQTQVKAVFSGVAFSRDPLQPEVNLVAIEALPGEASQIVGGQVNPEAYQVIFPDLSVVTESAEQLIIKGAAGDVPPALLGQVALLVRELEGQFHGIPQDMEWSFDGQTLWVLQTRPITTLLPIWTRRIAAEVIPGVIRPLTWSINRPLTCGVWGQLFTLVLGKYTQGLDFQDTATLHFGRAYFNASLLSQLFLRMGLPPESLEFLTRGAKMSRPPLKATFNTLPGLWRLAQRERSLGKDFQRNQQRVFRPLLQHLAEQPAHDLTPPEILARIHQILAALELATNHSILAPLSVSLRQMLFRVPDVVLDASQTPEAASLEALQAIATASHTLLGDTHADTPDQLFLTLRDHPAGLSILNQLDSLIDRYGYLSAVATDIAVPTWREDPSPVRHRFFQLVQAAQHSTKSQQDCVAARSPKTSRNWVVYAVQSRLNLRGEVSAVYSQLLAQLRWSFIALERQWLMQGILQHPDDVFFLEFAEITQAITDPADSQQAQFRELITWRRHQFDQDQKRSFVPTVLYGNMVSSPPLNLRPWPTRTQIQGIGASPGIVEGQIKIVRDLVNLPVVNSQTILVVPYTDAGWGPLLASVGGLIAEVGGRLSHGAIVAREYGIPAVMEVAAATHRFQDDQWVRLDGQLGRIEILEAPR